MSNNLPWYETDATLGQESIVFRIIARRWNCIAVKLPVAYRLDFALTRDNKVLSFCEFKNRNYTMNQFDDWGGYLLSLHKWTEAQSMCKSTGVPFVLVVKTIDNKIWYSVFKDDFFKFPTTIGGRKDRNDSRDIEPCVLIDVNKFTLLKEIAP
jgi:hypothetical protein